MADSDYRLRYWVEFSRALVERFGKKVGLNQLGDTLELLTSKLNASDSLEAGKLVEAQRQVHGTKDSPISLVNVDDVVASIANEAGRDVPSAAIEKSDQDANAEEL
ncbi:hypothetical protein Droror1_Dr00027728, partial [Drosera rotundifolia]